MQSVPIPVAVPLPTCSFLSRDYLDAQIEHTVFSRNARTCD
jgi:hypothetical protein